MSKHHITPKAIRTALAVLAVPAAAVAAPGAATAGSSPRTAPTALTASASCPAGWASLPEANSRMTAAPVTAVRTGRHACFDRLVVDLKGKAPGYDVRYVSTVRQDGSGFAVPVRGGARLQVVVRAPSYGASGQPTYRPANRRELSNVSGYRTFRQVAFAGSFEGQTTIGLGVRARLPFRVFTLAGPGTNSRLVVDVVHHW
ncbi:hypothetical protein [Kribbella sp. NPDC048915]|uniref:AMIN-like domain-containing (lipo)protein n=1 Tax=Kribbella sp. NPDC048915 TaxID=3155148 RepID=UPI0033F8DF15